MEAQRIETYLRNTEKKYPIFNDEIKNAIRFIINRNDYPLIGKYSGDKKPKTVEAVIMGLRNNDLILSVAYDVALFKANELLKVLTNTDNKRIKEIFTSENKTDVMKIDVDNLVLISSSDNYTDLFYKENGTIKNKHIRITLTNIENQLKKHSFFIRCHRKFIINKKFIQDFKREPEGYRIMLSGYNEKIPVSRQYLPAVRDIVVKSLQLH